MGAWSSAGSNKEMSINGGPLTTMIRLHRNSMSPRSDAFKQLEQVEYLALQSANKTRCYVSVTVINQLGFGTIEEFRQHLIDTDISIVECVSEISESLNIAASVILYYDFERDDGPEAKAETKHAVTKK